MQKKYKKEGLAAVSVSLDDAGDAETEKKVLRILEKMQMKANADLTRYAIEHNLI